MAVLSVQLVFSMIMASFLAKMSPSASFARWILVGKLMRYLHPSDEELRTAAGVPPKGKGRKDNKKGAQQDNTFTVPKNVSIQLDGAVIKPMDVLPLNYYVDYQWLLDFGICAVFIFLCTELYYILIANEDFNLSMLWCLLVAGFCVKVMLQLTVIYFRVEQGGEWILCVVFGFLFLVMAMGVLIVDEQTLEFGLQSGYQNFSRGARSFLEEQGIDSAGPASMLTFRIILAIFAAVLGSFLTFPGLRLAKMHSDALRYCTDMPFKQLMLHLNILVPLLISLTWVKPIVRDLLVRRTPEGLQPVVDHETLDVIRIVAILLFCLFRFSLVWTHLQAHLNLAVDKVEALKHEAGRISSIDYQKTVTRVFYYLCVVALQYLAPLMLLFFCAIMLKTMGDYSMLETAGLHIEPLKNMTRPHPPPGGKADSIMATATQFSLALTSLRQVFTAAVFRGLFSFLCWWLCVAWFTTSAFGLVYYSYFTT